MSRRRLALRGCGLSAGLARINGGAPGRGDHLPVGEFDRNSTCARGSGSPTESSAQAPEQPNSMPTETPGSSTSVAVTSSAIPVRAVDKAADAGISENTRTLGLSSRLQQRYGARHLPRVTACNRASTRTLATGASRRPTKARSPQADRHGCDAADVNGDQLKDIFCTEGAL